MPKMTVYVVEYQMRKKGMLGTRIMDVGARMRIGDYMAEDATLFRHRRRLLECCLGPGTTRAKAAHIADGGLTPARLRHCIARSTVFSHFKIHQWTACPS